MLVTSGPVRGGRGMGAIMVTLILSQYRGAAQSGNMPGIGGTLPTIDASPTSDITAPAMCVR
jgi:hypothetical protein